MITLPRLQLADREDYFAIDGRMRRYRAAGRYVRGVGRRQAPLAKTSTVVHENLTAALMGDPPIGRRAIDMGRSL